MSVTNHVRIREGHTKKEEKTVGECVKNFLDLKCELPWDAQGAGITSIIVFPKSFTSATKCCLKGLSENVCNSTGDTKRYFNLMTEIQYDMTLPRFIEKTKCILKSSYSQVCCKSSDSNVLAYTPQSLSIHFESSSLTSNCLLLDDRQP